MRSPLKSTLGDEIELSNLNIADPTQQNDLKKYNKSLINYLKTI
jgi:hypothetical protein